MTLFGWDASDFDWDRGPMDVAAAARDGIVFLTHKLTEGRGNRHVHAGAVLARGRDAGIPFLGGYHVVHTTDPAGQVAYLLDYADRVVPWWRTFPGWFWQCDAERWETDFPPRSAVKAFCDQLAARTGRTVICYASKGQYGDTLTGLGRPLWNANYGTNPAGHYRALYPGDGSPRWGAYSGQTPMFLQYSDRATIGRQPNCDANAYRGSLAELRALIEHTSDRAAVASTPTTKGDDMPNGEVPAGFAFDENGGWLDGTKAVPVPLPNVGHGPAGWGDAWLYLAGSSDATIRFGTHASDAWDWRDATLGLSSGAAGPFALPQGTDKLLIGHKRTSATDKADAGPVRWHVQYGAKG